jgi:hypothetical protein
MLLRIHHQTIKTEDTRECDSPLLSSQKLPFFDYNPIILPYIIRPEVTRQWKVASMSQPSSQVNEIAIDVWTKTDHATTFLETMYGCLIYNFDVSIPIATFESDDLMLSLQIVDPTTLKPIPTNRPFLKGVSHRIPLQTESDMLTCHVKFSFTNSSWHHNGMFFAFLVSIFDVKNTEESLIEHVSPAFKVLARRPSKRSLDQLSQPSQPETAPEVDGKKIKIQSFIKPILKKIKVVAPKIITPEVRFLQVVETLHRTYQLLDEEQKEIAVQNMLERFGFVIGESVSAGVSEDPVIKEEEFLTEEGHDDNPGDQEEMTSQQTPVSELPDFQSYFGSFPNQ